MMTSASSASPRVLGTTNSATRMLLAAGRVCQAGGAAKVIRPAGAACGRNMSAKARAIVTPAIFSQPGSYSRVIIRAFHHDETTARHHLYPRRRRDGHAVRPEPDDIFHRVARKRPCRTGPGDTQTER